LPLAISKSRQKAVITVTIPEFGHLQLVHLVLD